MNNSNASYERYTRRQPKAVAVSRPDPKIPATLMILGLGIFAAGLILRGLL